MPFTASVSRSCSVRCDLVPRSDALPADDDRVAGVEGAPDAAEPYRRPEKADASATVIRCRLPIELGPPPP
jgi:hypothetical protein